LAGALTGMRVWLWLWLCVAPGPMLTFDVDNRDSHTSQTGENHIAAMAQREPALPTFQEALKQDKAQFDDCTPCRIVGMTLYWGFVHAVHANLVYRQRNISWPRCLHLRLWSLPNPRKRGSHPSQQKHVWHAE
jgi:hypothetical protein